MKIKRFNENLEEGEIHPDKPIDDSPVIGSGNDCIVEHKDILIKALNTLMYSWGGDTPPEAVWAGNELLEWFEAQFQIQLNERFDEDNGNGDNFEAVIEAIRNC